MQFELAISLNHDVITLFLLFKWPWIQKSEESSVGRTVWGYCHIPMGSISMCSNTLNMSNVDPGSSGWGGCQPQPWQNDIILTPQVTQNPKISPSKLGITVWGYYHMPMNSISMCSNTFYMSNVDSGSSCWGFCQPQPWCTDIILTPQVTQNPKIWA